MDKSINLPEAPASATARVVTEKGFHLLFTLRDTSHDGLMAKLEDFQKKALAKGWNPEDKEMKASTFKKVERVESAAICAVCGSPAKRKTGYRKDGSLWEGVFCSTGDESHKAWLN